VKLEGFVIARQWLDIHVPAAKNAHATIKQLLDVMFSMQSVPYQNIQYVVKGK
jgi:hypothetical protein